MSTGPVQATTLMPMSVVMAETIDSRTEILQHILDVRAHLDTFVTEMLRRRRIHDASKFDEAEQPALDEAIPLLRGSPTGPRSMWRF